MTSTGPQDMAGDSHAAAPIGHASSGRLLLRRDFNPTVPNVARVYDHLLGGKDNFAADREAAAKLVEAVPGAAVAARENRAFLGRAVRFLAEDAGVHQFLDIGAGLPTVCAVHEIAQDGDPWQARVVYADYDHSKSGCSHGAQLTSSAVSRVRGALGAEMI